MQSKLDVAREYIRKFPDASNRALAKLLVEKHKSVFPSSECARSAIRAAKGSNGAVLRRELKKDTFTDFARQLLAQEAEIPEETKKDVLPYVIETGHKYLVLCDAHIPEHSKKAIETAIAHGVKSKCNAVLELGDMNECKDTSRFQDEPGMTIAKELMARVSCMKYVRSKFKGPYYSKIGNHEDNLRRYCVRQAPALAGLPHMQFENILRFSDYGVECIESKSVIHAGKISLIHGHEYGAGSSSVSPARWLALRTKSCSACGHYHRSSAHTTRRLDGFEIANWSIGCLRNLMPEWITLNDWNWGFAELEVADDGAFEFRNYRILGRGDVVPA